MGASSDKTAAGPAGSTPPTILDRFFLFGFRSVLVIVALAALGIFLVVHGFSVGRLDFVASGAIVIVIGVVVGIAALRTEYTMITQKYFEAGTIVGKEGRAQAHMRQHSKGVVLIEHETWSAIAEEEIAKGELVTVTAVEPDKVTLRVRKQT